MKTLTARQQQIFDLIKSHIQATGIPPTRAEIATHFGFKSANAAEEHIKALARKGVIEVIPNSSRGIKVVYDNNTIDEGLPLIGKVAAGSPILATEHIDQYYKIDPSLFKPYADFLLKIEGMSMKNVGILDGDLLAVHKTQNVKNGQIVVARIGDEVTVKRLDRRHSKVFLIAENESFSPIVIDLQKENFSIEGLAVGVVRSHMEW